ncbi:MAG: permease [Chloroflexi bacterium]|nr:MAG: permease [Chloroflexota bacterium]
MEIMDKLAETGYWFVYISLELTILFLVISFIIGVITTYFSPQRIKGALEKRSKGPLGNALGATLGGLLPFCSCSSIPVLIGLINVGVPFRIAMSFLVASPLGVFNPVVISLFSALFGLRVALAYIVTTFIAAVLAGMVLNWLGLADQTRKVAVTGGAENIDAIVVAEGATRWERTKPRLSKSWRFTRDLYKRMLPFILGGVAIGAFIHGFVPEGFLAQYAGQANPFAVPLAAAVGVPMYIRTSTLIPIASALVEKGVGLGTVMALIIGGAGASIPELGLLSGIFKRKLFITYIITIFLIATIIGLLFNFLAGQQWL